MSKNRLRNYLLGAPRFTIMTSHKQLLPMFNKATAKIPPRIEKWVMEMTDLDYKMKCKPGMDECDQLDYLSRHPTPEKDKDKTDKVVKQMMHKESAIVIDRIQDETGKDRTLELIKQLNENV